MAVFIIDGLLYWMAYSELSTIARSRRRAGSKRLTLRSSGLLGAVYKSEKHDLLDEGGLGTLK